MDDSRLNELFTEFRKKHPKMDYFSQEEIFQFGRMAFHLGYDSKEKGIQKPVIRSDGKKYSGLRDASRKNKTDKRNIQRSIKKGYKAAGYNWSYV